MAKLIRFFLIFFILLFFLVTIGLTIVIATFDPNDYKAKIQAWVKQEYQRDLNINGEISISYLPWLGLEIKDITLSDYQDEDIFLSAKYVKANILFWSLLSKHKKIGKLELHNVDLALETYPEGNNNWQDLIKKDSKETKPGKNIPQLTIEGIDIKEVNISYLTPEQSLVITQGSLQTSTLRLPKTQNFTTEVTGLFNIVEKQLQGEAKFSLAVDINLNNQEVTIHKSDLQLNYQSPELGKGSFTAGNQLDINLKNQAVTWKNLQLQLLQPKFGIDLALNATPVLSAGVFSLADLEVILKNNKDNSITKLSSAFYFDTKNSQAKIENFLLTSDYGIDIKGKLEADLPKQMAEINFNIAPFSPRAIAKKFDITLPTQNSKVLENLAGHFILTMQPDHMIADLNIALDQSNIKANMSLNNFKKPKIVLNGNLDNLNIDDYVFIKPTIKPVAATKDTFSLQGIDIIAKITANNLIVNSKKFSNIIIGLDTKASVENNMLDVSKGAFSIDYQSAELGKGSLSLQSQVHGNIQEKSYDFKMFKLSIDKPKFNFSADIIGQPQYKNNTLIWPDFELAIKSKLEKTLTQTTIASNLQLNFINNIIQLHDFYIKNRSFNLDIAGSADINIPAQKIQANLDISPLYPKEIAGYFNVEWPNALEYLAGKITVETIENKIAADIDIQLDQSHIISKVAIKNLANPQIQLQTQIDSLDIDKYKNLSKEKTTDSTIKKSKKPIGIKSFAINGDIKIAKLMAENKIFENVEFTLDTKANITSNKLILQKNIMDLSFKNKEIGDTTIKTDMILKADLYNMNIVWSKLFIDLKQKDIKILLKATPVFNENIIKAKGIDLSIDKKLDKTWLENKISTDAYYKMDTKQGKLSNLSMTNNAAVNLSGSILVTEEKVRSDLKIATLSLPKLYQKLQLDNPFKDKGALDNLSGDIAVAYIFSKNNINSKLDVMIDDSKLTGKIVVKDIKNPEIIINVNIDKLNLNTYKTIDKKAEPTKSDSDFPIKNIKLITKLQIDHLIYEKQNYKNISINNDIVLSNSTINIKKLDLSANFQDTKQGDINFNLVTSLLANVKNEKYQWRQLKLDITQPKDEMALHLEGKPLLDKKILTASQFNITFKKKIEGVLVENTLLTNINFNLEKQLINLTKMQFNNNLGVVFSGNAKINTNNNSYDANIILRAFSLKTLYQNLKKDNPFAKSKLPAIVKGNISISGDKNNLALNSSNFMLDNSLIKNNVKITNLKNPAIVADLNISTINIDSYFPPQPKNPDATPDPKAQNKALLPLQVLRKQNIEASIFAKSVRVNNLDLSNVDIKLVAKNKKITINPAKFNISQGKYQSFINIDISKQPIWTYNSIINSVQIGPILKAMTGKDQLIGRANMNSKLTTVGNTMNLLKRNLNGSYKVSIYDGAIKGFNIAQSIREITAFFDGSKPTKKPLQTDFTELTANGNIKKGVFNNILTLKSPLIRVNGNGTVNLVSEKVNYNVKVRLVSSLEGQGGKTFKQLQGIDLPFTVVGHWSNLQLKTSAFESLANSLFKSLLKDKAPVDIPDIKKEVEKIDTDKIEDKIKDKLKDKLKDELKDVFKF